MFTMIYAPGDSALANRIQHDVQETLAGIETSRVAIVVLSPEALRDRSVERAIIQALDGGQHIIPVLAKLVQLPKLIDHLPPLDFSANYDRDTLAQRVVALARPDSGLPLRVRTPAVRSANRRAGLIVGIIALIMFMAGLYMVGVLGVQAPAEEYATIRGTETAEVREIVERYLPRSTQDALDFPSTIEAAPTRLRPLLSDAATATAIPGR